MSQNEAPENWKELLEDAEKEREILRTALNALLDAINKDNPKLTPEIHRAEEALNEPKPN